MKVKVIKNKQRGGWTLKAASGEHAGKTVGYASELVLKDVTLDRATPVGELVCFHGTIYEQRLDPVFAEWVIPPVMTDALVYNTALWDTWVMLPAATPVSKAGLVHYTTHRILSEGAA